jgi:nicotinate-nucleotide pyrophosphorylase (carboxylating)
MIFEMPQVQRLIEAALAEDIGAGDATTHSLFGVPVPAEGRVTAKQDLVFCGGGLIEKVYRSLDPSVKVAALAVEGSSQTAGATLARIEGDGRILLMGERVMLNFLQRLCGIATLTRRFVAAVSGTKAAILDTRKTTPGLRILEKYAVRAGGGRNHRLGLDDGILIKDNHIALAGSVGEAVARARRAMPKDQPIEVEIERLDQIEEAIAAGASVLLLDNFPLEEIRRAVSMIGSRAAIEASGGITLANVRDVAMAGVDYLSIGALTHSAPAADISLSLTPRPA